MILDDKLVAILERLLAKSRANEVNWLPQFALREPSYVVRFPRSSIALDFIAPRGDLDWIRISVYAGSGEELEQFKVVEGDRDWDLVRKLFREAERCVTGSKDFLGDLEEAVSGEGKIGLPP